jgi:hypothetical protein
MQSLAICGLNSGALWTGVRSCLVNGLPTRTPPARALYSDATPKLRASGDDCLAGANEVGNVVGKRLTSRELFWANAACRARRNRDQREHYANRRQTNHHSLRPACLTPTLPPRN